MRVPLQILWCSRCSYAFTFTGARTERAQGGKLAVRHECGAVKREQARIAAGWHCAGRRDVHRVSAHAPLGAP